jgi:hypothetical protein
MSRDSSLQRDLREFQRKQEEIGRELNDVDRQIKVAEANGNEATAAALRPSFDTLMDAYKTKIDQIEQIRSRL